MKNITNLETWLYYRRAYCMPKIYLHDPCQADRLATAGRIKDELRHLPERITTSIEFDAWLRVVAYHNRCAILDNLCGENIRMLVALAPDDLPKFLNHKAD